MNTASSTSGSVDRLPSNAGEHATRPVWKEVLDATPLGIVFHAIRDIRRREAHRQAVLQAFRR